MQEIQSRKRKLESDLKEILDKFHKENEIHKVSFVSVQSGETKKVGKNEVTNTELKVSINLEVI